MFYDFKDIPNEILLYSYYRGNDFHPLAERLDEDLDSALINLSKITDPNFDDKINKKRLTLLNVYKAEINKISDDENLSITEKLDYIQDLSREIREKEEEYSKLCSARLTLHLNIGKLYENINKYGFPQTEKFVDRHGLDFNMTHCLTLNEDSLTMMNYSNPDNTRIFYSKNDEGRVNTLLHKDTKTNKTETTTLNTKPFTK